MAIAIPPEGRGSDSARKAAKTMTLRGHSRPPAALARWIELANADRLYEGGLGLDVLWFRDRYRTFRLHPEEKHSIDAHWLDSLTSLNPPGRPRVDMENWNCEDGVRELARLCTLRLSRKTHAFLGSPQNLDLFVEKLNQLESAGQALCAITNRPHARWSACLLFEVRVVINEHGQGTLQRNPVLDALVGAQLDHIKSCALCGRFFWAPRSNSRCCGLQCRNAYNQRKSRARRKRSGRRKPKDQT
jgi:hypothetical protein